MAKTQPSGLKKQKMALAAEDYNAYLNSLRLESVRLASLKADLIALPEADVRLAFDIGFKGDEMSGDGLVVFLARYKISIFTEGKDEVAEIMADFAVSFLADDPPPKGFTDIFYPMNLSRMTYPFFREVVAGITAKMELPTLFVPLNIFGGKANKGGRRGSK